jgi:hypothetical protein
VPVVEKLAHQVVLGGEVPVEGDLGDARGSDHAVDAGGADAVAIEEVVRGDRMRSRAGNAEMSMRRL